MSEKKVTKYFDENSDAWISSSYDGDGYDYPTARLRSEKTCAIINDMFPDGHANLLDLGCGGGHMAISLVKEGFNVTGIDNSSVMLARAQESKMVQLINREARDRLHFRRCDILKSGLPGSSYDVITALGLIGYLDNDYDLLIEAYRLLRPGGIFVVSCRNRLFNMVSISDHTLREIEQGTAGLLVKEIQSLYQQVSDTNVINFVSLLSEAVKTINIDPDVQSSNRQIYNKKKATMNIDARQHTPDQLMKNASECGFGHKAYYGINPHFLMASVNNLFPPGVYHRLSSSLEAFDELPVSLIWSSVFIGVFVKNGE
tara:strand:- start:361 stop:1305 length:945 start_codon:yes stop_codon:yes gene_type:complete